MVAKPRDSVRKLRTNVADCGWMLEPPVEFVEGNFEQPAGGFVDDRRSLVVAAVVVAAAGNAIVGIVAAAVVAVVTLVYLWPHEH